MSVEWHQPGDLVIWDNTCVMYVDTTPPVRCRQELMLRHRACPGAFEGKYRRDMRRTTVHDDSSTAWGLNIVGDDRRSGLP